MVYHWCPSRMPLFSVSSLVNMPSSPAPKSLSDFVTSEQGGGGPPLLKHSSTAKAASSGPVFLPATASHYPHPSSSLVETSTSTSSSQFVHRKIFAACKMDDLNRLKRYLTPANVNIRDTSGGRSTVSAFVLFCH